MRSVKSERASSQVRVSELTSNLEKTRTELEAVQVQVQVSDLNSKLEERLRQLDEFRLAFESVEPKYEILKLLAEYSNKSEWTHLEGSSFSQGDWQSFSAQFKIDMEEYVEAVD